MNEVAILFNSKPAQTGETVGFTLKFNAQTMALEEVIADKPYCSVVDDTRLNTKYIPDFEDLQPDLVIEGNVNQ